MSEPTIVLFEAKPESVGEEKRRQIARVYDVLERALLRLQSFGAG